MDANDKADFDSAESTRQADLTGTGWDEFLSGVEKIGKVAIPILEKVLEAIVPGLAGNPLAGAVESQVNALIGKLGS